jgi:uncharacterized protein YbjT (DUF2867 family)
MHPTRRDGRPDRDAPGDISLDRVTGDPSRIGEPPRQYGCLAHLTEGNLTMTTAAPGTTNDSARTIAVIGATGLVGRQVVDLLHGSGHSTVQVAQGSGIDMLTGEGLDAALDGVDAVIDVINSPTPDDSSEAFFAQTSANLSTAAARAGITHYVVLSIVGADLLAPAAGYMRGKLLQEAAAAAAGTGWTVVRSTQFHELAAAITESLVGGDQLLAPDAKIQPIASAELAAILVRVATSTPLDAIHEVGGPQRMSFADMSTTVLAHQHRDLHVVTDPTATYFGHRIEATTLVPRDDAERGVMPLVEWLART